MKTKHNKKRNTAFIFESLVHEMTKAVVSQDSKTKDALLVILKEHFGRGSVLDKELQCFQAMMQGGGLDTYTAEKTIHRAKQQHSELDHQQLFREQSQVIKKINKTIGSHVFSNFVPSYRMAATVAQIFGDKASLSHKVLMEKQILQTLTEQRTEPATEMVPVDSLVVKSFVEKYNTQYESLLPEQRSLLERYILAFGDNDVDFRLEVGAELKRLHEEVKKSLQLPEVASDHDMVINTKQVLKEIEKYDVSMVGEKELKKILKLQGLVREYETDATEN